MMNTRCTKLSMVRDDSKSSKTSNKKCPVVLHGDHILFIDLNQISFQELILRIKELLGDFSCFAQLVSITL